MNRHRFPLLLAVASLAALSASTQAQDRVRDLIYMKEGGAAFTMDAFTSAKPNGAAIISIISGGWFSSHGSIDPAMAKGFTDNGYTVFEVVHGSQPLYKIPMIERQILRSVRFVRSQAGRFGFDPMRIGITGGSAGGHLALETASRGDDGAANPKDDVDKLSSKVQAVVAFFPPTDFLNYGAPGREPMGRPELAIFAPAFGVDLNGPREPIVARAKELSPILKVSANLPPILLIHGDADPLVPLQQSQSYAMELDAKGVTNRLVVVPNGKHGGAEFVPYYKEMFDWFTKYLAPKKELAVRRG